MKSVLGSVSPAMVLLFVAFAVVVMLPEASATRWTVGGNMGWTTSFNYTTWIKGKHFYNGDWLFFVYDRNQMNVREVNKTDYESCNSDHPLHDWTTGAGRDVVPLNVTRNYYFISGKGFCFGGMKIAVHVENPTPPPKDNPEMARAPTRPPATAGAPTLSSGRAGAPTLSPERAGAPTLSPEIAGAPTLSSISLVVLLPVVFAITGAAWDAVIHFW